MARLAPTSLTAALGRPCVGRVIAPSLRPLPLRRTEQGLGHLRLAAASATFTAACARACRPRSFVRRFALSKNWPPKVVFVIGGPGSGKGTQCELAEKELNWTHLSAGELLREERRREGSELGAEIEAAMTSGKAVPSEVIAKLLEKAMRERGGWESPTKFVIDGYPRSEEQLRGWTTTLGCEVHTLCCLSIEVDKDEMRNRLLSRAENSDRVDDNEEVIEKRLSGFEADTAPLLKYFKDLADLRIVDGSGSPEEVFAQVRFYLKEATEFCADK